MLCAKKRNLDGRMVQQLCVQCKLKEKRGGLPCLLAAATIQVGQTAAIWCYLKAAVATQAVVVCIYCHDKLFCRVWPSLCRNLRASGYLCMCVFSSNKKLWANTRYIIRNM